MPEVVQLPRGRPLNKLVADKRNGATKKNEGDHPVTRGSPSPKSLACGELATRAEAHLVSRTDAPERLHRRPPRRGPSRTRGARSCITEACLGVSRSTPAVRAAERRSKRGRAVNRRPLRSLRSQRTPRVARLPARDRPVWPGANAVTSHRRRPLRKCRAPRRGCRPSAPSLVGGAAGRATETVPTSECRRRPEGTSPRTSVAARTSGSARREARGAFTLEARAENYAPDLGGRTPDPDTLPSYRVPRARGPGTSRVPEPAPLRVRSR
jgi:hypothetical protein